MIPDDEIILYATPVEPPAAPAPEIVLPAQEEVLPAAAVPPPPPLTLTPKKPAPAPLPPPAVVVQPPAPKAKIEITLPATAASPAPDASHGAIYALLEKNYYDPALLRSSGLEKVPNENIGRELFRLPGVRIVPAAEKESAPTTRTNLLPGRIGYWRAPGLAAPKGGWPRLSRQLREWNQGGPERAINGLILDLRGTTAPSDFAGAARLAALLMRPEKALFTVDGPQTILKSYKTQASDEAATVYDGPLVVLVDAGTRGAAEALADVLRRERNAILVGQATPGEAALFGDFRLDESRVLHMPVAAVRRPDDHPFLGEPITPDIAVSVTPEEERLALAQLDTTSPAEVIASTSAPPEVNETILARDQSPQAEAIRRAGRKSPAAAESKPLAPKDIILLQAVDALKAITVLPTFSRPAAE